MSNWSTVFVNQNIYDPLTVEEVVTDKFNIIHKELYNNAIKFAVIDNIGKYFEVTKGKPDIEEDCILCLYDEENETWDLASSLDGIDEDKCGYVDLIDWKIYEDDYGVTRYFHPTKAVFTSRTFKNTNNQLRYIKFTIDLTDYWFNEYNAAIAKRYNIFNSIDWCYPFNDIIEYDYVKGLATVENRVDNKTSKIRFRNISMDDELQIQKIF